MKSTIRAWTVAIGSVIVLVFIVVTVQSENVRLREQVEDLRGAISRLEAQVRGFGGEPVK